MSLNKRSLKKDAKPEPSLESTLAGHERALKSRRGTNRKAAFDALRVHDEDRAIKVVVALAKEASGKNLVELGCLLASTDRKDLVEAAARGKFGDVPVWEHVPTTSATLHALQDALPSSLYALSPAETERRARAIGLVPLRCGDFSPRIERIVTALVDDKRLSDAFRGAAILALLPWSPAAVWVRRENAAIVPIDVAVAAGIGSQYVGNDEVDVDAFAAAIAKLPPADRAARVASLRLPRSAQRFGPDVRTKLFALALDTPGVADDTKAVCALNLADMNHPAADEALLARPDARPTATLRVCERLQPAEALPVLLPLLRKHQDVRDAVLQTKLAHMPGMIEFALAILVDDPVVASALLVFNGSTRATDELVRLFETCVVDDAIAPLLFGVMARTLTPAARTAIANYNLIAVVDALRASPYPSRELRLRVFEALEPRATGENAVRIRHAIRHLG